MAALRRSWMRVVVFVVLQQSLEGWTEVMDRTTDVAAEGLVIGYFIVLVWLGAFFMTHYLLAQICLVFMTQLQQASVADELVEDEYAARYDRI